jgi:hypothetical protein
MQRRVLTSQTLAECRLQRGKAQYYMMKQGHRSFLSSFLNALHLAFFSTMASPPKVALWLLQESFNLGIPQASSWLSLEVANNDSDVPVWLRVQLWESIPDPHYVKIDGSLTSDGEEELQLLIRPLSIDIGAWAGQRSCITTFPNPQSWQPV